MHHKLLDTSHDEDINDDLPIRFDLAINLDDERYYKLPKQIQCDFEGRHGLIQKQNKLEKVNPRLAEATSQILDYFQDILNVWDVREREPYIFNLPPSYFIGEISITAEKQKTFQQEYNQVQPLSKAQISQIYQSGTFEIPSHQFPIPYIWQLSTWVIKGRKQINNSYFNDLAVAYSFYKSLPKRIYSKSDKRGFPFTLRSGLYYTLWKTALYLSLIIGFKSTYHTRNKAQVKNLLEKQRQKQLQQLSDIEFALYKYFEYDERETSERQSKFAKANIGDIFQYESEQIKVQMQNMYDLQTESSKEDLTEEEQQEYRDNLQQLIQDVAVNYLEKYNIVIDVNLDLNQQITDALHKSQIQCWSAKTGLQNDALKQLINLNECNRIFKFYYSQYKTNLNKQVTEFIDSLKVKYPIRSLVNRFVRQESQKFRKQLRQELKAEMMLNIRHELKNQKLAEEPIFANYVKFKQSFKADFKLQLAQSKIDYRDTKIQLSSTRAVFPPYQVIYQDGYYMLKRHETYYCKSDYIFWRIHIFLIRWYTWTMNSMYSLFANAIAGPLGIRALCSIHTFHPDVCVDRQTGLIKPTSYTVTPVIQHLIDVFHGMSNSRRDFENAPDTGFFGKNCARLWNLFEVYIFRFIIVGIICVGILLPMLIIANVCLSLILAITAWAWIPVVLILTFIFQLIIYDFDIGRDYGKKVYETQRVFPLIVNTWNLLFNGIFQMLTSLVMIFVIYPMVIIFMTIFAHFRYLLRSAYDILLILVIKYIFRSLNAWVEFRHLKIHLLGLYQGQEYRENTSLEQLYFNQISNEHFIILIAAELERCLLKQYEGIVKNQIYAPQEIVDQEIKAYFQNFNAHYNFSDHGCGLLSTYLQEQIKARIDKLPRNPSQQIRFSKVELDFVLSQTKRFLKKQITLKNMSGYIWTHYGVNKGDYNELLRKIILSVFGQGILEPFEDLEMRFKLTEEDASNYRLKIARALEGQINIQKPQNYKLQKKRSEQAKIITKEFIPLNQTLNHVYQAQHTEQTWNTVDDKDKIFLMNLSLK